MTSLEHASACAPIATELSSNLQLQTYEKWIWVELVDFDKEKTDLGVSDYLGGLGFQPNCISFLVGSPDFVHEYDGEIGDQPLDSKYCALFGRAEGLGWTGNKMKRLIAILQASEIKVYLGLMAMPAFRTHGISSDWVDTHKEALVVDKYGSTDLTESGRFGGLEAINPLSRFKDGTYYQDFFAEKLGQVLTDYGFDGFHGADGFKAQLKTLEFVSYSDNMVEQFQERTGVQVPDKPAGDSSTDIMFRSEWIWLNHRREWIEFNTDRWVEFWATVVQSCRKHGKDVIKNSAWPTDPVDAIQKFGVDFKRLFEVGVEKMVFEAADGAVSMLGGIAGPDSDMPGGYELPWQEVAADFNSAYMLINAYAPDLKLIPFTITHDTFEHWDMLRHARPYMEKSIYSYTHRYRLDGSAKPQRCASGYMICLGHDIYPDEWNWIKNTWDASSSVRPARVSGPVFVWSDDAVRNEIGENSGDWGRHRSLYSLISAGLPVLATARIEDLAELEADLFLVINPASLSEDDRSIISQRIEAGVNVACLGAIDGELASISPAIEVRDVRAGLKCQLFVPTIGAHRAKLDEYVQEARADSDVSAIDVIDSPGSVKVEIHRDRMPSPYTCDLNQMWHFLARTPAKRIPDSFLRLCADMIRRVAWPRLVDIRVQVCGRRTEDLNGRGSVSYLEESENELVLLAENHTDRYLWLVINLDRNVSKVEPLGQYFTPPTPEGTKFHLVVPPNGIVPARVSTL
jgi:hypothetical protein